MPVDSNTKILLVEDAATMRKMEIKILRGLGFTNIIEAVDGNDAIEKLQAEADIQIIISDWAMPNKDGLELLEWIRADARFAKLPMIMATGQGDKGSVAKAMEAGATGVVAKPFTPEDLKAEIEGAFGQKPKTPPKTERLPEVDQKGKVRLKIAHIQITDHLTLGIMKHMIETGARNPEYFSLETLCMPGWNPVQTALEAGDVDAAFILAPMAMDLFNYGVPIRLVLFTHRNGSIFVRTRSHKYQKPYQQFFKHKTFFIPHKMSIHNMLAHIYFTQMGLKPGLAGNKAVNVLFDVAPPIRMPDFLAETPDSCGFMVAEPIGSRAIAGGIADRQLLSSEMWDNHPCCVAVFREEFIGRHPDAVQEFCNLLTEAGRFIGDDPKQSAQIAVSFLDPAGKLGLKPAILKKVLTDPKGIKTDNLFPVIEDLDTIQRYMHQKMGIGQIIDLESFVDLRFAEEIVKNRAGEMPVSPKGRKPQDAISLKPDPQAPVAEAFQPADDSGAVISRGGKYLTFGLAEEKYGIGILDVREIIGMMPIRPIPRMPDYIKGVINLRKTVIPVIDIRLKFGMAAADYNDRTCIIVVEVSGLSGSTSMGIVVDNVWEVADIKDEEIQDPPQFGQDVNLDAILGLAKKAEGVTILLDIDQILHTEEIKLMAEAA